MSDYENEASLIRCYLPLLLRTQAYMEAQLKSGPRPPAWRRRAVCGCVEVAANLPGVIAVRDSERPENGAHVVVRAAFARFLGGVQGGATTSRPASQVS